MSWEGILKQDIIPTRTSNLALALAQKKEFEKLLNMVEAEESLPIKFIKMVTSLKNKNDFLKNQFINIYAPMEGATVDELWERMQVLLEAMEPKMGRKSEAMRDKLLSAYKNPKQYRDFIAELKENPLTAEQLKRLSSVKAREAYRKIMEPAESEVEGITMPFKFKAGSGPSKKQFTDALVFLSQSPKITRSGNNLVFDAKDMAEVSRILRFGTKEGEPLPPQRGSFDRFLKPFMVRTAQAEQIAMPKMKISEALSDSLLTGKEYTVKANLSQQDFTDYLEVLNKSRVAVQRYLPKSRGASEGIADEVYLSSAKVATLSPYGSLVLKSDFGQNWREQFFGNVKLSSLLSKKNAEQAVITDILEELRSTPVENRKNAKLYGALSLEPFAEINLNKKTKGKTENQYARDRILEIIRGSSGLTDMLNAQSSAKQRNTVKQMQDDATLLTISEAIEAQKQNGGKILYYDSSLKQLEDTSQIQTSGMYARVRVGDRTLTRDGIKVEELSPKSARVAQQIRDLIASPTDDSTLADIVSNLVAEGKIENVLQRSGRRNRLEQVSIENGLIFLIEMGAQYGDESLKETMDKAIIMGTGSREQFKEMRTSRRVLRKEVSAELDRIDESMSDTLETYKNGMLEALSVKLSEIAQNYEKLIGSNPEAVERIIGNLLRKGLLGE